MGHCVNDRGRRHELLFRSNGNAHLPVHCQACMCSSIFREIKVLGRSGDTTAGELMGAFYISARGNACVSDTSVFLFDSERNFLRVFL